MIAHWNHIAARAPEYPKDWLGVKIVKSEEPAFVPEREVVPLRKVVMVKDARAFYQGAVREFEKGQVVELPFGKTSTTDMGQVFIDNKWARIVDADPMPIAEDWQESVEKNRRDVKNLPDESPVGEEKEADDSKKELPPSHTKKREYQDPAQKKGERRRGRPPGAVAQAKAKDKLTKKELMDSIKAKLAS